MWTVTVTLDNDKPDVGTATAVWNAGLPDAYTYSRRLQVSDVDGKAFAKEAKAARKEVVAKAKREATQSVILAALLAAEEAKV